MRSLPEHDALRISPQFRPVPLWSWNDVMEPATCAEMMRQLAEAGYGGAYLHARLGMEIDFLSPSYLESVKACVSAASRFGVHAHLYDEDRWPSGWAGGEVPLQNPSFRLKALVRRNVDEADSNHCRKIAELEGFRYGVATMPLGHPKFNGTCYSDLTDPKAMRCFLSNAYVPLQHCLGKDFQTATPTIFTDEPALTYLYSWPDGGLPWSEQLPQRFRAATGMDLTENLPALFEMRANSPQVRIHYYRILVELFGESFMDQISKWCRQHGIRWTGHFMYEHSLPLHFSWSANCHGLYRHFDWPGVDHLGRQVGEVVTAIGCRSAVHQFGKQRMMTELFGASGQHISFADRKWIGEQQIVLGANHLVPHLVSTTLRGPRKRDYPPTLSPHQPWWSENRILEDHLARLCEIMASGAPLTDLVIIHPQESAYVLADGPVAVGKADTWVGRFFHPACNPELQQLDQEWKLLCHRLLDIGYLFDFADEGVLAECGRCHIDKSGTAIQIGAASYRTALIPPLETIRLSTANMLLQFAEAGGELVQLGRGPRMIDGSDDGKSSAVLKRLGESVPLRIDTIDELQDWLLDNCPPELRIVDRERQRGRIWQYSKLNDNCRTTFLVNLDRLHTRRVSLCWRAPPKDDVTVWNTDCSSSSRDSVEDGALGLTLPPGGSCLVIDGERPSLVPPPKDAAQQPRIIDFDDLNWKVSRLDDNALVIDCARFRIAGGEWQGPVPVLAIKESLDTRQYAGPVDIRYEFAAQMHDRFGEQLQLIVEGVEKVGHLQWNGQAIDLQNSTQSSWVDPHWHPIKVPRGLLARQNCIDVRIGAFRSANPASSFAADRTGTDIEPVMILGDFAVDGQETSGKQMWEGQVEYHTNTPLADWLPPQPMRYYISPFVLSPSRNLRLGNVTSQGLPFYVGRLRYETDFHGWDIQVEPVRLRINSFHAPVATVDMDGERVGSICWPPYEVDLPLRSVPSRQRVAITLYHSLRNLLGPHHHPDGEPVYVTPGSFRPEGCAEWLRAIQEGEAQPTWTDAYSMVEFGLGSVPDPF